MDLDHVTGGAISGWDHVAQSIQTLLATRLNTRVFRRDFGSDVPGMIDAPMNDATILTLYVAVAEALARWEPRFDLTDIGIEGSADGRITLTLQGNYTPEGHKGDLSRVDGAAQTIRVVRDRVDNWSLAA